MHEFNASWLAGLQDYPSATHWKTYGEGLATVLHEYLGTVQQ